MELISKINAVGGLETQRRGVRGQAMAEMHWVFPQQECYSQIRSLPHAITQFQQTFLLATSLRNMLPVEGRAPRTP